MPRENEASIMSSFATDIHHDAIFCSHNGIFAKEHADFLAENKIHKKTPLYSTQFSFSDDIINSHSTEFDGVKIVSSWLPNLDTPENQKFVSNYKDANGIEPSVFGLLGYENGLLILNYLKPINEKLETIKGPRGAINMNTQRITNSENISGWHNAYLCH